MPRLTRAQVARLYQTTRPFVRVAWPVSEPVTIDEITDPSRNAAWVWEDEIVDPTVVREAVHSRRSLTLPTSPNVNCPHGYRIVYPEYNEIFLDIDSLSNLRYYERMLALLQVHIPEITEFKRTPSKTSGHWHVVLQYEGRALTNPERIAFQACLGSDRKRELLSMCNLFKQGAHYSATVFYEKIEEQ